MSLALPNSAQILPTTPTMPASRTLGAHNLDRSHRRPESIIPGSPTVPRERESREQGRRLATPRLDALSKAGISIGALEMAAGALTIWTNYMQAKKAGKVREIAREDWKRSDRSRKRQREDDDWGKRKKRRSIRDRHSVNDYREASLSQGRSGARRLNYGSSCSGHAVRENRKSRWY